MNAETKNTEAKKIIQEWMDKQGHERCWYYPELFTKLAILFEVKSTLAPTLPPLKEFEEGCRKYQIEEYHLKK